MAVEHIESVIGRLSQDKAFRTKYCQDPDGTLEAYLTPDEIRAIKTGDGHSLALMGYSQSLRQLTEALCGPHPCD